SRHRDRRCAVLRASRPRLYRDLAGSLDERSTWRKETRGSEYDHPAIGTITVSIVRAVVRPKDSRIDLGLQDGSCVDKGADPRNLFESNLLWSRGVWGGRRSPDLLRKGAWQTDASRSCFSRRTSEVSESLLSVRGLRSGKEAPGTCVESDGRGGVHHAGGAGGSGRPAAHLQASWRGPARPGFFRGYPAGVDCEIRRDNGLQKWAPSVQHPQTCGATALRDRGFF